MLLKKQVNKSWAFSSSLSTRVRVPLRNSIKDLAPTSNLYLTRNPLLNSLVSPIASHPSLLALHRSAAGFNDSRHFKPSPPPEVMYKWHLPEPNLRKVLDDSDCLLAKSRTVVVLLGWLGAKQKHLKRYADWYTSRGYNVITFTFPMNEILSYQVGGKAEQHIDMLVNHLAEWLDEEHGKSLVFHTFSNTGWLTYGVVLEKFQNQDQSLMGNIRGCIVDSAPVATPDPRVWASGFSAAFLKKQSIATKESVSSNGSGVGVLVHNQTIMESIPTVAESALLVVLEKFFEVVLNLSIILLRIIYALVKRLSDVMDLLSVEQPKCPQLYIYSSADRVIPVESVESFIEKQRRAGHEVRACNFVSTPHVDHYRNDPSRYTSQLTSFLEDCVLTCCKHTS
ncbi:hypothetical protein IFM89_039934 [Coptis chinensis]|uniref:Transmembrane protein 53 n=1 Tax=Coptis chinensis TaxID=261450 RepID=A0A835GVP8_9MAGN|nr:hypothetical protein IFM89_039934 [Coptis chinensis]